MFADKLKYMQGYVRVRLTGYAPERFLNLCSNRNILIWNLEYRDEHYEFCISVKGFRQLKPILRKTKTRLWIMKRYGFPFFLHRYRKRKIFFAGIALCGVSLYMMSLFIWNIEVNGNLHRTDSTILKFLEEKQIHHGIPKSKLDCASLEELLRSQYDDVIWASVKIQGTRLIIDIQENLVTNETKPVGNGDTPVDLVAAKDAEIHSIFTRKGTPLVEKGSVVKAGDMLVEGKIPIYNDNAEVDHYQYCPADADILGITTYTYEDKFSMAYEKQVLTGETKNAYQLMLFGRMIRLPFGKNNFASCERITSSLPLKLGKNFYLPVVLYKEQAKEYRMEHEIYAKKDAEQLAQNKLIEFCKKLQQKGVQIIENNVMIEAGEEFCISDGTIKVIEPMGKPRATTIDEIQQEGQNNDESDGNNP